MTTVSPLPTIAGTKKQSDLPPPVGMMQNVSRPDSVALMTSRWFGRNVAVGETSLCNACCTAADHENVDACGCRSCNVEVDAVFVAGQARW